MPLYRVWYRDIEEPLEFSAASRLSETEIVARVLTHEKIDAPAPDGHPAALKESIAAHQLAPVRYTEDESEINNIG